MAAAASLVLATASLIALGGVPSSRAEEARALPAPVADLPADGAEATAILAGGCFWGVQGVFQHVAGVTSAVSGYAGGEAATAQYEMVGSGTTGHAEAVRVTYDPRRISYGRILQIYFSVAHDPTQRDRQGPDHGTQYRSAIFPTTAEQDRVAQAYIAQLDQARAYDAPVVTTVEPGRPFYPAEGYHQDFLTRHPHHPYILVNDRPKIEQLRRVFPDSYAPEPVLVSAARDGG